MIAVTLGGTTRMIRRDEVRYVQAQATTPACTPRTTATSSRADGRPRAAVVGRRFVRIHRSYLVAIATPSRSASAATTRP